MIAKTPEPPYYAVIFTSLRTPVDNGYGEVADYMVEVAAQQEGFLGIESVREELGITVSYWDSLESIAKWKHHAEHTIVRERGRAEWYSEFKTRICKVERDYGFEKGD